MKKKYQKPIARELGDFTTATGQDASCGPSGIAVSPACLPAGTSYTDCIQGPEVFSPSCDFGRSADSCITGVTALP